MKLNKKYEHAIRFGRDRRPANSGCWICEKENGRKTITVGSKTLGTQISSVNIKWVSSQKRREHSSPHVSDNKQGGTYDTCGDCSHNILLCKSIVSESTNKHLRPRGNLHPASFKVGEIRECWRKQQKKCSFGVCWYRHPPCANKYSHQPNTTYTY